jgi:hypothetical protein
MRVCFAAKINLRKVNHRIASACGLSSLGPVSSPWPIHAARSAIRPVKPGWKAWIPSNPETQRHHRSAHPTTPSLSLPGRRTHDDHPSARANSPNAANHAARRTARLSPRPRPRPGGMAWRGVARQRRPRQQHTKPSVSATTNARRRRIQPVRSSQPASQRV